MCKIVEGSPFVLPGWGCCECHTYNGAQRDACRSCAHKYDGPAYEVAKTQMGKTLDGQEVEAITEIRVIGVN